ncbi:YusG family protein [Bacillus solitudinis]|uniref:YusG family protein n=1 Tax=Bacillus solitudinis TaxID=2014074 RepID=UPI000C243FD3|nr:YusG family protein [Bacillus solitudinis]
MDLIKVDVTSQVNGRMENGIMNLYMGKASVGKIIETNQGLQHEMAEGYTFQEDKIYRFQNPHPEKVKSYVDSCEEGWC